MYCGAMGRSSSLARELCGCPNRSVFYAVGDGVWHRGKQQVDVGQEDANKTGSMFAKTVDHGQANHGDVQDQDCWDTGQAVLQSLEMLPLGCDAHSCLTGHNI